MKQSGQQQKLDQIAKRINKRHNLGRQSAARAPNGLMLGPLFAPVAF